MRQWYKCLLLLYTLAIVTACRHDENTSREKEDSLKNRIESLESQLAQMNSDLSTISGVVNALQNQLTVTNIQTDDTDGHIITLSDNSQLTLRVEKNETEKNIPIISVAIFEDMYYWTQTVSGISSYLTDTKGNKVPVTGENATTPLMKINMEGYWTISYDNGANYGLMSDNNGTPIQAVSKEEENDSFSYISFFHNMKIEGSELVLTLADGVVLRLPISKNIIPDIESVEITGKVDIEQTEGLKIISLINEQAISNGAFTASIPQSEQHPQLTFVTNEQNAVLLISREFYGQSSNEINIQSTALALVASHPVFAPVEKENYTELKSMITASPAFSVLCGEIQKSVETNRDLFDINNTALVQALNTVLDELCTPVIGVENHLWKQSASQIMSEYPFQVTQGTDYIEIRNTRLAPPYEYIVRRKGKDNIWEEYERGILPTRDSYGYTDIFKSVGEIHLADPITIQFPIDGEYDFYFDKTTERAAKELQRVLLNDALSIIGVSGNDLTDAVIEGGNLIAEGADIKDYVEYASKLVEKQMEKMIDKKEASPEYLKFLSNAYKFLDKFNAFYSVIKGSANEVARILWAVKAPTPVEFCFSCFEKEIMPCAQSGLKIVSGNNQEGNANNYLSQPLKVQITSINPNDGTPIHARYHQVKFEVIQGNGTLSKKLVQTDSEGYAETQWKLGNGSKGEIQKVRAVILDVTTGSEVGTPKEFTAVLTDDLPIDWTCTANHSNITSNSVTISCTYPEVGSNLAVFGLIIDKGDAITLKPWKNLVAEGKEHIFHVDGLSPATTYCYVPYVLYQGIYHKGEKISFTTLPEKDIDIELSKGRVIDLGLSVKWASCNLGASSPEEYGVYFPFNKDMEQTCQTYLTNGLRMPTKENVEELVEKCRTIEFSYMGVKGTLVIGPNGNNIFLPRTGTGYWSYEDPNNPVLKIDSDGRYGMYWTKTVATKSGGWWLGAYTLFSGTNATISVGWEDGPGVDPGHYNMYHTIRPVAN